MSNGRRFHQCTYCNYYHKTDNDHPCIDCKSSGYSNPSEYTNYGDGFDKGYEDLYLEKFKLYLGSCSRYMMNQRLKDEPYRGENGAIEQG